MANINDVINWQGAQYKQKPNLLPQLAETGVTSFFAGMEAGPKERQAKLDEQIKMYDLAIKMMEAAQKEKDLERYNLELRKDFNNSLGITEKDKTAGIMTEAGKVLTGINDEDSRIGKLINSNMPKYKREMTVTPKGTTYKYTERDTEIEGLKKEKLKADIGKSAGGTKRDIKLEDIQKDAWDISYKMVRAKYPVGAFGDEEQFEQYKNDTFKSVFNDMVRALQSQGYLGNVPLYKIEQPKETEIIDKPTRQGLITQWINGFMGLFKKDKKPNKYEKYKLQEDFNDELNILE